VTELPTRNGHAADEQLEAAAEELSPRAREVQQRIAAGTYEVDLDGLAERLLQAGALSAGEEG
jgi:hypothetical protein